MPPHTEPAISTRPVTEEDPAPHPPRIGQGRLFSFGGNANRWPWWALVAALIGVLFTWTLITDSTYQAIFGIVSEGIVITIFVTVVSYALALLFGLILAFARVSNNFFAYQLSTFFVEIIRGAPMLVLLLYIAFVVMERLVFGVNSLGTFFLNAQFLPDVARAMAGWRLRDVPDLTRVIVALSIAYSAFISEIFRAGIESIDRGQMEAGRALGMTYWQAMLHVILPQAVRVVLPPLANDFISMLKDSSLVSVLGVRDITLQGKIYATNNFRTFEPYNVVAFLYLVMTLLLSIVVRWIERRMSRERRRD